MNKSLFMKVVLAVLLGLSVCNEALSQNNYKLKGQNRLLKGVEQYRLIVKFSQDEIVDIDNNKPLARTASKERFAKETLVNKHSFHQVFSYSQSDRKAMRGPNKPTVGKGKFNHFAFRGLVYVNGSEKMDKNTLLQLANDFEKLPSVEYASLEPVTPIAPPSTPDLTSYQHYKYAQYTGQANVYGIDAEYAWSIGINGQGVKIADIEWGFNYQHEDLTGPNFIELAATTNHDSDEHGTAVAGIMYAKNNGLGITGMVHGADKFYGVSEFYSGRVGGIALGLQSLSAGDVFLYEMQMGGQNGSYVPADFDQAVWDITKQATDAGILVVAAAGNGNENLDDPFYNSYRARGDNGSIRVGAGTKVGRDKASFSTYGSPIHLQGWGDWTVAATGYGDLYNGGTNAAYTNTFSGTSSATPIVASAVVAVQSYSKNVKGTTLSPLQMRALLIATGTAQGSGGHIGPLPNIRKAIETLAAGTSICTAPAWNATTVYQGDAGKGAGQGEVVSYNAKQYRAKWWTQNNTPGTSDVWLDLGACGTANTPPTVSITSPTNNAVFNDIPATIEIVAEAGDQEGAVAKVEFFNGTTKLGEDLAYPYTYSWTNVAVGTYTLTAKATDNSGATTTSVATSVTVAPPSNYAPIVTLTSPAANSKYIIGGSVTVSANVSDPDNDAITKVEVWSPQLGSGSTVTLTTPPYTTTFSQLPAIDPRIGGLTFVVKAYDSRGATGYQDIFVSQDKLPQVYISSPSNGSTIPSGNTTITAEASDDATVTKVDFLNAVGAVIFSDNTAPYQYSVNLNAGNYTYRAIAYDNVNQSSTTANVSFTVSGATNQVPTATMTSPANGVVVQENTSLVLSATAADVDGTVSKVEFYSNTGGKLGEATTTPYQITLPSVSKGNVLYFAKAIDNYGAEGYSTPVAVTINGAPVVTITAPLPVNGINPKYVVGGSLTISTNVTDADGTISKVEFTKGGSATGMVTVTAAPFTATFTNLPAPAPDGSYFFNVKAYDNNGGTATALVIVYKNRVPTVTITSPANNATFAVGSNVTINTLTYDPDFVSGKVEFFNGATKLGEVTSAPFNFTINGVTAGSYAITAKVTDDMGESGTSAVVSFTVPTNTCTAPAWNSTTAYSTNAIVSYNGIKYKENEWSQGATPDTHSAPYQEWTNQGTCNSRLEEVASALGVYPNPATDVLNISVAAEEVISAEIRNLNGELILSVSKTAEINVSSLASGLYTISIRTSDNNTVQKFIKQ